MIGSAKTSSSKAGGNVTELADLRSTMVNTMAPVAMVRLPWGIEFVDYRVQHDHGAGGEPLMQLHETSARVRFFATDLRPRAMDCIARCLIRQCRSTLTQPGTEPAPLARDDVM